MAYGYGDLLNGTIQILYKCIKVYTVNAPWNAGNSDTYHDLRPNVSLLNMKQDFQYLNVEVDVRAKNE